MAGAGNRTCKALLTVIVGVFFVLAQCGGAASADRLSGFAQSTHGEAYRGLQAADSGPCRGGFIVKDDIPGVGCTHGPDQASAIDGPSKPLEQLLPPLGSEGIAAAGVPCIGDGTSGFRVEAIYAHAADRPDLYAVAAPIILASLETMVEEVRLSAEETGGVRTIRFVTSGCQPVVRDVTLSAEGDDSIGQTASDLAGLGFDSPERDYVTFVDANVYCGIGYMSFHYARIDTLCWSAPAALHELTHNLGGVQLTAPNSSGGFHCTDESDDMCYSDQPNYPAMRQICPFSHEMLLDCNHDDYFSTDAQVGTFLSIYPEFNTAESPFLGDADGESPVFLPQTPISYTGSRYAVHAYNADDDECVYGEGAASLHRVRLFCIGYGGDRTTDITGALLSLAGAANSATVRLVATDRGGGDAFGFAVFKDGVPIVSKQGGQVGVSSAGLAPGAADPSTGWPVFYEEAVTADLSPAPLPKLSKPKRSSECKRKARELTGLASRLRQANRSLGRLHHSLVRLRASLPGRGSPGSRRRYRQLSRRYRDRHRLAESLRGAYRRQRHSIDARC